jgi:magnesium transporter
MLTVYHYKNKKIVRCEAVDSQKSIQDSIWIDLSSPTLEEEKQVEGLLGIDIPTQDEMMALELSNRLYKENEAFYLTITILAHSESKESENKTCTFVLTNKHLITVRYTDTQPFSILAERLQKNELLTNENPRLIAIYLFEAITNRLADILEKNGQRIDIISKDIFHSQKLAISKSKTSTQNLNLKKTLCDTGIAGDTLSKIKESLVSMHRLICFVKQSDFLQKGSKEDQRVEVVAGDIAALSDHASFLANKVTFLLDATLGLIEIQQNSIIKIFSIAAVIFLPPTLVASIYGMNFRHMPELNWVYGYPLAILMIILAAYLPYRFFKFKNWL